jgi:hypothetical protein
MVRNLDAQEIVQKENWTCLVFKSPLIIEHLNINT